MKRIICIICAAIMAAAVLTACGDTSTRTVVTDSGTTIEINRDKLTIIKCMSKVNDGEKTAIDDEEKAEELFNKVEKLRGNELSDPETGDNHIELTFIVAQGYCGYYILYDNGAMSFSPSPKTGEVKWYSYNKDEYENILAEIS